MFINLFHEYGTNGFMQLCTPHRHQQTATGNMVAKAQAYSNFRIINAN
jgi:hypothetical protein